MIDEDDLRLTLQAPSAGDAAARRRAWGVVQAAAARRDSAPRRRLPGVRAVTALAALMLAVGATATASAPHSGVGRLVRDVLGIRAAPRAALVHLPGGGRLLVQAGGSTWIVEHDGHRRRLGAFEGASWSPHGLFLVAWHGSVLTALEPGGSVRWSLSRPDRVTSARWSPGDGFRIAYLAGGRVRIVNGDGTGDRDGGPALAGAAPAWRPGAGHVLAYVDAARRVNVAAVDTGVRLWRSAPLPGPVALAWSPQGRRLLVVARHHVVLFDGAGHRLRSLGTRGAGDAVAWAPRGDAVAIVRSDRGTGTSAITILSFARGVRPRLLVKGPGPFGPPTWSPDGHTLLAPWPAAGRWLFLPTDQRARAVAVSGVAQQFAPGASRPPFPSRVQWCCGPPPAAP